MAGTVTPTSVRDQDDDTVTIGFDGGDVFRRDSVGDIDRA